ncbi:unnamed protein product [Owenia fusiformis]|uniref:Cyclin-like domain-containing protein n=1 Tax=Owenia fusiformis TaxID=6347 RepID=A0A8S4PJG3_OWEFU|nr:unnamed protein product [Owenia fusiformis]
MSRSTRMHMNSRASTMQANKEQTGATIRGKDYVDSISHKGTQPTGKRSVFMDLSNKQHPNPKDAKSVPEKKIPLKTEAKKTAPILSKVSKKTSKKAVSLSASPIKATGTSKSKNSKLPVKVAKELKVTNSDYMNLSKLGDALDEVLASKPVGVLDIDTEETCMFRCPEYAQDVIDYLMSNEARLVKGKDFMKADKDVNPHIRAILIDWLIQVQAHLNLTQETLYMSVMMLDEFLVKQPITLAKVQLLGLTCLFIAAKFHERFPPDIAVLTHLTEDTYTFKQVIRMELIVLRILDFDLNFPSQKEFVERYLQAVPNAVQKHGRTLKNLCLYLIDITLHDINMMEYTPSMKAAASVYMALKVRRTP